MENKRTIKEIALQEMHDLEEDVFYQENLIKDLGQLVRTNFNYVRMATTHEQKSKFLDSIGILLRDQQKCLDVIQGDVVVLMALREFIKKRYPDESV